MHAVIPVLTHLVGRGRCPSYMQDIVETVSMKSARRLLSSETSHYTALRLRTKFDDTALSFAGSSAWNYLPNYIGLRDEAHTRTFICRLLICLFQLHFMTV